MYAKCPSLKILLLAILPFFFLCSSVNADEVFPDTVLGTKIGVQENADTIPEGEAIFINCIDIVKNGEGSYNILGVMSYPGKDVYVWKGKGEVKDGSIIIRYYGVVGESAGDAKLYFTEGGQVRFLFDGTVFELQETP